MRENNFISFLSKFICIIFIGSFFSFNYSTFSETNSGSKNVIKDSSNEKNNFKTQYLLGPGDGVNINFLGLEIYSKEYLINKNGELYLPELGNINVTGLTITELKNTLEKKYSFYIKNPNLRISISKYRDISVYVDGEIKLPGLYKFELNNLSLENVNSKSYNLFDLIKQSGGFTNNADLSNIVVIRENSNTQGGGKIKTKLNLLYLLNSGDQSQNIELQDGDYIFINKSKKMIKEQIIAINKTNFSPNLLNVYITGNVIQRGALKIKKGSSLNQAIALAGGKKILTGKIEYLSFNYDGSTEKRSFKYNSDAKINSFKNPILNDGDVINVKRTILGQTTEVLSEISSPVLSGLGLYQLFSN